MGFLFIRFPVGTASSALGRAGQRSFFVDNHNICVIIPYEKNYNKGFFMNNKNKFERIVMLSAFCSAVLLFCALQFKKGHFVQRDLDDARTKLKFAEHTLDNAYEFAKQNADSKIKTYPEYKELDSLIKIHRQNPEAYYHLEPRIDSLDRAIVAKKEELREKYIEDCPEIENARKLYDLNARRVIILEQDSINRRKSR